MNDAVRMARDAIALADMGDDAAAESKFAEALARFPYDGRLANSAGNFHARAGRHQKALTHFRDAISKQPGLDEALFNAVLMLLRLDLPAQAVQMVLLRLGQEPVPAKFLALAGDAARLAGDLEAASTHYRDALMKEPSNIPALTGRASLSLERGAATAVADHERALALAPGNPQLFHDYALALWEAGEQQTAHQCAEAIVRQLPEWAQGHSLLADFNWALGKRTDFDSHFARACRGNAPAPMFVAWAGSLSGVDRHAEAADVLRQAQKTWPDDSEISLCLGVALSEAQQADAAEAVFATANSINTPEWRIARARNLLRLDRISDAENMLGGVVRAGMADISAWALIDICWRLQSDARHHWLHGQEGLVRSIELPIDSSQFSEIRSCLHQMHRYSAMPIGQSVKDGSQTKGALLARQEPEIQLLAQALREVCEDYRAGLPPFDETHPLLSRRDAPWSIIGSWSIKLAGKGHHAAHIHPRGLLSSACYFEVPVEIAQQDRPGWLELGRPPSGLINGLSPLHWIRPQPGHCAIFPSTLFHATTPITIGTRMTVAFDVMATA